ncbi:PTS sugar transporter subunit IIA [uncultured Faecalicoccus sp.]|uniref:PTS sugar transporter subunit IIA n=1 Tax=uncultured Faecalicoccus sp. TaxID=1971760 RepID=UPI00258B250F|nr:PTS sugar transporter subunit IIA [uncultured Faecalicoccus sp.]
MKKNKKILIASHGSLAKGMFSSLNIIIGKVDNIETLCGYLDADFNLEHSIATIMEAQDFDKEELIVCTDMVGGSVNNGFIKFLGKYPFHLVSNVNLPFLIDLILSLDSFQDNTLETKVKEDVFGVKYINPMLREWTNLEDV